jgi:hypothetical protein
VRRNFVGRSAWKSRGITGYAKRTARVLSRKLDWQVPFEVGCTDYQGALDNPDCPQYFQFPILSNAILRSIYEGNATILRVVCDMTFYVSGVYKCVDGLLQYAANPYELRAGWRRYTAGETLAGGVAIPNLFSAFDVAEAHYHRVLRHFCQGPANVQTWPCNNGAPGATGAVGTSAYGQTHLKFDDKRAMKLTGDNEAYLDVQLRGTVPGLGGAFQPVTGTMPLLFAWGFIKVLVAV